MKPELPTEPNPRIAHDHHRIRGPFVAAQPRFAWVREACDQRGQERAPKNLSAYSNYFADRLFVARAERIEDRKARVTGQHGWQRRACLVNATICGPVARCALVDQHAVADARGLAERAKN